MPRWSAGARQRLRAAAMDLFAEQGYAATTVAAVAERAGLTERTFFRHFADKAEVLFADDAHLVQVVLASVREAPDPADAWAVARRGLAALAGELGERREELRLRAAVIAANPELAARDLVKHHRVVTALQDAVQGRGADPHAAALSAGVAGAVFRVAYAEWLAGTAPGSLAARVEHCLQEVRAAR